MILANFIINTFKEALAKKIILTMFIVISLILLLFLSFLNLDSVESMQSLMQATGQDDFGKSILAFQVQLVSQPTFLAIFTLCIILVSSFIPSMLEKGYIDLLLSKPISRFQIILGRFISGVLFIFFILTYLIGIIWIMVSFKSGVWNVSFLLVIPWFTYIFAVLYSLIILVGLVTNSTIITIIINGLLLFPVSAILAVRKDAIFTFVTSDVVIFIFNFFYYILPNPWDLREIAVLQVQNLPVETYVPLITSFIFMLAMLCVSVVYFMRKDY